MVVCLAGCTLLPALWQTGYTLAPHHYELDKQKWMDDVQ